MMMEIKQNAAQQVAPMDLDTILYTSHEGALINPSKRVLFAVLQRNATVVAVIPITGKISTIALTGVKGFSSRVKVNTYDRT